jgi:hypothetical protein
MAFIQCSNFFFFSSSNSRIRSLVCSGFYEFHLLCGLPGSLLPSGLYQRACFGTLVPLCNPKGKIKSSGGARKPVNFYETTRRNIPEGCHLRLAAARTWNLTAGKAKMCYHRLIFFCCLHAERYPHHTTASPHLLLSRADIRHGSWRGVYSVQHYSENCN